MKIKEVEAREILLTYDGYNNHILNWKRKLEGPRGLKLTRPQADYIIKYHQVKPIKAKKFVKITGILVKN